LGGEDASFQLIHGIGCLSFIPPPASTLTPGA
jgi:hypothetical protein